MSNNRSGIFIGGVMLGATIGALAGLLVAPRTGKETRKLLKKICGCFTRIGRGYIHQCANPNR